MFNHSTASCKLVDTNFPAAAAAIPLTLHVHACLQQLSQLMAAAELPKVHAGAPWFPTSSVLHTTIRKQAVGYTTLMCVLLLPLCLALLLLSGASASAAAVSAVGGC
jgi:hypothetical protein